LPQAGPLVRLVSAFELGAGSGESGDFDPESRACRGKAPRALKPRRRIPCRSFCPVPPQILQCRWFRRKKFFPRPRFGDCAGHGSVMLRQTPCKRVAFPRSRQTALFNRCVRGVL